MENVQGLCTHQGRFIEMVWKEKAHPEGHAHYQEGYTQSLHKHKINRENQAHEGSQVIPMQGFALEEDRSKYGKDNQGDNFLNDLKLHQCERATIFGKTDAVCRNLKKVFR